MPHPYFVQLLPEPEKGSAAEHLLLMAAWPQRLGHRLYVIMHVMCTAVQAILQLATVCVPKHCRATVSSVCLHVCNPASEGCSDKQ